MTPSLWPRLSASAMARRPACQNRRRARGRGPTGPASHRVQRIDHALDVDFAQCPCVAASRTRSGSSWIFSRMPVIHTRHARFFRPQLGCSCVKLVQVGTILCSSGAPRMAAYVCGSAPSIEQRISSRPLAISLRDQASFSRVALVLNRHRNPARLEVGDHARQVVVDQRFADAVQNRALHIGKLVHDAQKVVPARVSWALRRDKGARTGFAQQVAVVGDFDKDDPRTRTRAPLTGVQLNMGVSCRQLAISHLGYARRSRLRVKVCPISR